MNLFVTIPFVKPARTEIPPAGKGQGRAGGSGHRMAVRARAAAAVLWGLGLGLGAGTGAAAEASLPARNLLIEWRVTGMTQSQKTQQGIRSGQLIIDSRGQIIGRTGIGASRTETESRAQATQQVQVINGGRARLFVGQTQPHLVWQWAWVDGGRGGLVGGGGSGSGTLGVIGPAASVETAAQPRLAAQTVWLDIGQGLHVRPRWPGGHAPVLLELEAQSRTPVRAGGVAADRIEPDGQTRRVEVGSTLSVPLGEWSVVARSGSQATRQQSGTLSTRELDSLESEQLEVRVTAP